MQFVNYLRECFVKCYNLWNYSVNCDKLLLFYWNLHYFLNLNNLWYLINLLYNSINKNRHLLHFFHNSLNRNNLFHCYLHFLNSIIIIRYLIFNNLNLILYKQFLNNSISHNELTWILHLNLYNFLSYLLNRLQHWYNLLHWH
jgi:hypothetical protein